MATKQPVRYEILHNGVGSFLQGQVVTGEDLGKDVDVKRLLILGAIGEVEAEVEAEAAEAE